MRQTWRWFGPVDKVSLADIRQAGAEGIVTALYDIPPGQAWPRAAIAARRSEIEAAGLSWDVVESLPVSEAIRTGASDSAAHLEAYRQSLEHLAAEGIAVICYNFMPVLDWTRTDLAHERPSGARALRFDLVDFAAFDIAILERPGAAGDYETAVVRQAQERAASLSDADRTGLTNTILAGLPGAVEHWTLDSFRARLAAYDGIDAKALRANLKRFLSEVVPHAEALGLRLCCHPDDPPWPLFGLPRILSTEADYRWLVDAVPSPANGITLCTGSLGARGDVDLPGMMARLGEHVHFLHLRNVRREAGSIPCSFFEDDHLAGSTDMVAVIRAVLAEQVRRKAQGRADWQIPMRPDHGQEILDDRNRKAAPGYPAIGRLKGLAELRGVMMALSHPG
ncbi:mannonate dehydratase [Thalassococcus sp. CAU 1522]|uniref:Mannonate dehydratase n=1 Tax=Thalassococcus arenae TaxID=2851652 RepID=A0ABS6N3P7_9RHOB|nr:mannonate dehydratase [Thalassococcus arenae]MBV2358642.1 mannonate dehydratase [Thalassococcus arenae]